MLDFGHRVTCAAALLGMAAGSLHGVAAAQTAAQMGDRTARPGAVPAPQETPEAKPAPKLPTLTRPAPQPRPFVQPTNRPQPPELPQVVPTRPPSGGFGGSGGSSGGSSGGFGGSGGSSGGGSGNGNGGGFGGSGGSFGNQVNWSNGQWSQTVQCRSLRYRYKECPVDARGGAQLRRVLAGKCSPGNWGNRSDRVWVNNGCQAEFVVRHADWNGGGNWNGGGLQTSTVRCESRGYKYKECRVEARGGVRLQRVIAGDCRRGNWGYRNDRIWVDNGCRADFAVRGYGPQNDGGPSAGAVIGGIALAAGLAALIASSGKKRRDGDDVRSARIDVNTNVVSKVARPSFEQCLDEAAMQIGATGGTAIALQEMREVEPGNGGYRFDFRLRGTWPDETRLMSVFCRATPSRVIELDFQ